MTNEEKSARMMLTHHNETLCELIKKSKETTLDYSKAINYQHGVCVGFVSCMFQIGIINVTEYNEKLTIIIEIMKG